MWLYEADNIAEPIVRADPSRFLFRRIEIYITVPYLGSFISLVYSPLPPLTPLFSLSS